jgi:hypothetical protein
MKLRLPTLISLLVVLTLLLPSGAWTTWAQSAASGSGAQAAAGPSHVYLPMVQADLPPVIPDTTVPLTGASTGGLTVSPDGATFTFTANTGELQKVDPGDVIVGNASAAAPDGFLRKVTSVQDQTSGQVVLQTEAATLEEAVQDGAIDSSQDLHPQDVSSAILQPGVRLLASSACSSSSFGYSLDKVLYESEHGNVTASGSVCFSTTFNFSLSIDNFSLRALSLTNTSTETADLSVTATMEYTGNPELEIAKITFNSITFWIGWFPVVIQPVMTVYVGLDGSVTASITTGISQTASLTAGLQYASGSGWSPVWDFTNEFNYTLPTPTLEMVLKAYAGIKLDLMLYGAAGPWVDLKVFLELDVQPLDDPWWNLDAGLEVSAGAEMKIFGRTLAQYETTLYDHKWRLMPPDPPDEPAPEDAAVDQAINATISWTDPDSDPWNYLGPALTFDVFFGTDNPPETRLSNGQTGYSYDPGLLDHETQYYWMVRAIGALGMYTDGPVWSFTTIANRPPDAPSNPVPANGAVDVPPNITLGWTGSDPDGDALTYDVYFGLDNPPATKVSSSQSAITFNPGLLGLYAQYFWQIVAHDPYGGTTPGPVWSFTNLNNHPPDAPADPSPADGAINRHTNTQLSWTGSDPDGDALTYDVFFGTANPPPLVSSRQAGTTYNPGALDYNTQYYWHIAVYDVYGESMPGPLWTFRTMMMVRPIPVR